MTYKISKDSFTGLYSYEFWTGPDGIDHFTGSASSLGEAFEKIILQETLNALQYT